MMTPWRWLRYQWYVRTGLVHRSARIDANKRVYAVDESKHANDEPYWSWVRTVMPHALTMEEIAGGETFETIYAWLGANTTAFWSMRQSIFRMMNSGQFMPLPLKNVYYFANEDDAFAFRLRFSANVGEDINDVKVS